VRPAFGGYVIASGQSEPGLMQSGLVQPGLAQPAYGQAGAPQAGYGQVVYAQPASTNPMDIQPRAIAPPRQYPSLGASVGALPDTTRWPRRVPPADVPLSYAPQ